MGLALQTLLQLAVVTGGLATAPGTAGLRSIDVIVNRFISDTIWSVVLGNVNSRSRRFVLNVINVSIQICAYSLGLTKHFVNILSTLLGNTVSTCTCSASIKLGAATTCSAFDLLDNVGELAPTALVRNHLTRGSLEAGMLSTETAEVTILE